ncbi:hypothetical protein [Pseudonocardia sp. 73-21]|uniref:hypothetical protein n=1 Tax=Pseudonocardia sp. 73-21 TaxID=1895809 RepID=UPI00095FF497|nr:hypothetical protein [Pseudonocardia sp. 73-21]OJY47184.1 MAG: hypothetical protein BGP03_11665 [Pseudonocardia sp. 73-21]
MSRTTMTAVAAAAVAVLAGCGTGAGAVPGPGMMNGAGSAGYTYSGPTCATPATLPGHTVTVMLADAGMGSMMGGTAPLGAPMMLRSMPATVAAGRISLVAQNRGWRTHELVVLPLRAGSVAGALVPGADGRVDETGALGEASATCAADGGDGITGGAVGWTTVTLPAGRYELVCNLANHYADGMHQELDVTAG